MKANPENYKNAGVNLDAAEETVARLKPLARETLRREVLNGLGGFGGLFELQKGKWKNPVLVSGTDGVGTKLKLAIEMQKHDTIGIDLVAMCANDILVQGAEPLFFLDYLACGILDPGKVEEIVGGICDGCRDARCALLGGETAEMPGMYASGEYDLAGFAVGAVEKDALIDGNRIQSGDVLLGLPSSGLHSNGFSLVRKILKDSETKLHAALLAPETETQAEPESLGRALLEPTLIYVRPILDLLAEFPVKGMAHITGGGLPGNIPRMLPSETGAELYRDSWPRPAIFDWLKMAGQLSENEMHPVFNMGIGFVVCVANEHAEETVSCLTGSGTVPYRIGEVVAGTDGIRLN